MIKEKEININIVSKNVKYYNTLGYNCNIGSNIIVDINDVQKNSHINIIAICDICKNEKNISIQKYNKNYEKYNIYTCKKCSNFKNKITNNKKYGCDHPLKNKDVYNKLAQSNFNKYGVVNVFQLDDIKNKIKTSNNKKFGVDYPQQNKIILEKSNRTNMIKYGFNRPAQNLLIYNKCKKTKKEKYNDEFFNNIDKAKNTIFNKYGITNVSFLPKHKEKIQEYYKNKLYLKYKNIQNIDYDKYLFYCKCEKVHNYEIDIELFYNRLSHNINTCTICYPEKSIFSDKEMELLNFIKENYSGVIEVNDREILKGKELDIYIPDIKLAFEYNGLYWHSNIYKDDDYHLNKIKKCIERGVQLIHIWENDWLYNKDIVKNNIINLLKNGIINVDEQHKIESFYLNDKILENYEIIETIYPCKWTIIGNNRYKFDADSELPYIVDCGSVLLKNKKII
jgi:hypothetical protein